MRTRTELLADLRDMGQDETLTAIDRATAAQAADLLGASTPRPWPPAAGVTRCLAWRNKTEGWFPVFLEVEFLTGEPAWRAHWAIFIRRIPPQFWQPMPPEPEVELCSNTK